MGLSIKEKMEHIVQESVDSIITDIEDRKGLGDEWYQIDDEIQEEIKEEWRTKIKGIIKRYF